MPGKFVALWLLASLGYAPVAQAQTGTGKAVRVTVTWTAVGAAAGFGIGLWAGLTAFDDSINSDRKVWTSAIVGAGIGALGGYLISRAARNDPRPAINPDLSAVRNGVGQDRFAAAFERGVSSPRFGGRLRRPLREWSTGVQPVRLTAIDRSGPLP